MQREIERNCPTCGLELTISYELDGYKALGATVDSGEMSCATDPTIQAWAESEAQEDANNYLAQKADALKED